MSGKSADKGKGKRIWFPIYVGDYLRDVAKLTMIERAAYMQLLCEYWSEGKLPDNDEQLALVANLTNKEWEKYKGRIEAVFGLGWNNKFLDDQAVKADAASDQHSSAAKSRWGKTARFRLIEGGSNDR